MTERSEAEETRSFDNVVDDEVVDGEVVEQPPEPTTALSPAKDEKYPSYIDVMVAEWGAEKLRLMRDTIARTLTLPELGMFGEVCKRLGLDPFAKQIHPVKRWDGKLQRDVMAIQVGIDGFRVVAQRSKEYAGQIGPLWCGADGVWKDVWLDANPPAAAKVGVLRHGFTQPLFGVALWREYVQTDRKGNVSRMWRDMSSVMIAKCAEAIALRRAFPQELSGVYTNEEMMQAERIDERREEVENARADAAAKVLPKKAKAPTTTDAPKADDKPAEEKPAANEPSITEKLLSLKGKVDGFKELEALDAAVAKWEKSLASLPEQVQKMARGYIATARAALKGETATEAENELATQVNELAKT